MTEQGEDNKYINSSRCNKMKYHNNDDSIKEYFGFTRLGERLKTCTKCRANRKQYNKDNPGQTKTRRDKLYNTRN